MLRSDQCTDHEKALGRFYPIYPGPRDAGRWISGHTAVSWMEIIMACAYPFGVGVFERKQHARSDGKIVDLVATLGEDCGPNGP